jgi:hypothetical protein
VSPAIRFTLNLNEVVPWGRSYEEYVKMFNLAPQDLNEDPRLCRRSASFNAEATQKGYRIIARDPLYRFTSEEIASRIDETYETIVEGARIN